MKGRFEKKKRTGYRDLMFLIFMVGMIAILLFAYSSQFRNMHDQFNEDYRNIEITFFDHSIQKVNPSGKVKINGQVVYKVDSISKSLYQYKEINLQKGKHDIEISTVDDQYTLLDTIEVKKFSMKYKLWIQFNYNPPTDEYKQAVVNHVFERSIRDKDYTEDQRQKILAHLTERIDQEFDSVSTYNPGDPYFTFSFKDITHYPIE